MSDEPAAPHAHLLERVRSGSWLDAQDFPPLRWAVPGILPEGMGLFTGSPKVGKSWAAFGIALAVAGGTPALGTVETGSARKVLVLALEDGDRRLQGRARTILGDGTPIPANLDYTTRATPAEVLPLIATWLEVQGGQAPLVVLDTLGKVMPPALPGEGAYQRDYRIGSRLKELVDTHPGACLLVVHHTRKASSDDWMDSTSGTNGLNGAADFTATLHRTRNESTGTLRVTGRDVPEAEYAVRSDDGRWHLEGGGIQESALLATHRKATEGLGDRSAEIIAYVANSAAPVAPKEVEAALNLPDARRYLARLVEAGRINRAGRGLYTCVPTIPMSQLEELEWDKETVGTPLEGGGW